MPLPNRSLLLLVFLISLSACSGDIPSETISPSATVETIADEETEVDRTLKWKTGIAEIELKTDDLESIVWEDLYLTKAQFDDFLNELLDHPFNLNELDPELDLEIEIKKIDFNGEEIDFTLEDFEEEDFIGEFGQGLSIYMIDSFSRQYFLHSDYRVEEKQPTIRFYDEKGNLLSENNQFIDLTIDE